VIVGKRASYVSPDDAMDYVAGYCLHNDYSEREFQLDRGGQWTKGKSCDSFAPLGPFLATADEIKHPQNLRLWLKVNGATLQDSNTSDLIFGIPAILSYVSQFMTLMPGDVISTGTPQGVGAGLKPPRYLKHGDVIEYGIENLGSARHTAVAYEEKLKTSTLGARGGHSVPEQT
jgi:2,4-diketo-3-deoxy-L-fuconate hydrolase